MLPISVSRGFVSSCMLQKTAGGIYFEICLKVKLRYRKLQVALVPGGLYFHFFSMMTVSTVTDNTTENY